VFAAGSAVVVALVASASPASAAIRQLGGSTTAAPTVQAAWLPLASATTLVAVTGAVSVLVATRRGPD
jgi:hypothetical protein